MGRMRHLDTEKLRALLKRNYVQGPGGQGDEFFGAQTSLEEAKASNKRMQEEGAARAKSSSRWRTPLTPGAPSSARPWR